MGRGQSDSVFVFDEPTIGLHPSDVLTLLKVFQSLIDHGATVIVIEHDLDVIRNADYIIDMGPGGGAEGGRIVATGSPDQIREAKDSAAGRFIKRIKLEIMLATIVDTATLTSPVIIKLWFRRYIPITVVPLRSKLTVAMSKDSSV